MRWRRPMTRPSSFERAVTSSVVGPRLVGDDERVIARRLKRRDDAGEDAAPVVLDGRGLAVHRYAALARRCRRTPGPSPGVPRQTPSIGSRRERANHIERDASVLRPAGTRRNQNALRRQRPDRLRRRLVVAADDHLGAELAQVLDEVVGERIVVVDDENRASAMRSSHAKSMRRAKCDAVKCEATHQAPSASSSARTIARALSRVSSYSAVGFESATIPAPAWIEACPRSRTMVRMAMQKSRFPAKSR